ncbi:pilus assembly protein TadG-related protein, partial [Sphingorhabdus sp.]|uniref:pilus assembly protein TadG-related protein n=1 Tax=Sphingorhabdus sp. TaxID=1902408 RepID=UPI003919F853
FGLIAVGGLAFDYARMATLDTELQNAADQAALAGVTQLDGLPGARARATTAAQTLVSNITRLSNDGVGRAIAVPTVEFFTDANTPATSDADADRVRVTVAPRSVNYALTPVVGLLSSGNLNGIALAGLETSICNVPPLYMAFDPASEDLSNLKPGTGVLLLGAEGASQFGYLDNGKGGGKAVQEAMAWDDQEGKCQRTASVSIQTGVIAAVEKGFNTRFGGGGNCPNGGTCSAAAVNTQYPRDSCHANGNDPITPVAPCTTVIGNGLWPSQNVSTSETRYQRYKAAVGSNYVIGDDRRRLTVAVIPYGAFGSGSSGTPVTPTKWLDVFITEQITGNGNSTKDPLRFYVEIIGESTPATSGRRDVPYLLE